MPRNRRQRQCPAPAPAAKQAKKPRRAAAASYTPSNLSADLRPDRVREENYGFERSGLISVDEFSGTLSSSIREVSLPGNGGLGIEVYRRYESSRVSAAAWDDELMLIDRREK